MEKRIDKATERALEAYPIVMSQHSDNCKEYDSNESDRLTFIKGYHQAEKDLTDISWIKEVSGVKEMSRAKEEALKAYPPLSIAANYDTIARRDAFEYGYLKAEKDLELTCDDINIIINAFLDYKIESVKSGKDKKYTDEEYCKEVLKRFKNLKK